MTAYSVVNPVSPLKNTACRRDRMESDDHNVALRSFNARPEKCCDGAAVTVRSAFGSVCDSHQSSSMIRCGGTPHASRWEPTPSKVTKGTSRRANSRIVG